MDVLALFESLEELVETWGKEPSKCRSLEMQSFREKIRNLYNKKSYRQIITDSESFLIASNG